MFSHDLDVQVPRDLRAGGPLHLPRHPQHPSVLRHEAGRAAPPSADHQQDQQQRQEEHGRQLSQEGHHGKVNYIVDLLQSN